MADKQRFTSRQSPEENQNLDNGRNAGQNNRNGMSRDEGLQTGSTDHTDRNTSDQPGQSPEVTGPSSVNIVNTEGPVQQGAGARIIQNPTYNYNNQQHHQHHHHHYLPPQHITSPDQYLQWMEQVKAAALRSSHTLPGLPLCPESHPIAGGEEGDTDRPGQSLTHRKPPVCSSEHGNSSSFHVPCHCRDCQNYHHRNHPPLAGISGPESESRHSGQSHNQPVPQLLPSPQDPEHQTSPKKDKQHQPKPEEQKESQRSGLFGWLFRQRSPGTPRPSTSDVRPNATRTERPDDSEAQSAKTARSTHQTGAGSSEAVPDSVCIIDGRGQSLEPGDAVWFEKRGYRRWGIYVGNQKVVWCEGRKDRLLVHKEELKLTDPFGKLIVVNKRGVRLFPAMERVRRAESWVGRAFREGDVDEDGRDFPHWIFSGLGGIQAGSRGFWLLHW